MCVREDFEDTHSFFPAFPLTRSLPHFKADKQRQTDGPACPKYARVHPLLTPGAFTCFCAHGLCLGFSLMASQEGPRTPFELIYTRFKKGMMLISMTRYMVAQVSVSHTGLAAVKAVSFLQDISLMCMLLAAPSMVVYDNACNLQRYVLKRTPHYFRHTAFRIDRLHVFAHKG